MYCRQPMMCGVWTWIQMESETTACAMRRTAVSHYQIALLTAGPGLHASSLMCCTMRLHAAVQTSAVQIAPCIRHLLRRMHVSLSDGLSLCRRARGGAAAANSGTHASGKRQPEWGLV